MEFKWFKVAPFEYLDIWAIKAACVWNEFPLYLHFSSHEVRGNSNINHLKQML